MRKFFLSLVCLLIATVSVQAQFEKGTILVNTSISGLDLSYSKTEKGHFGFQAGGAYFFLDNLAVVGELGGDWSSPSDTYKLAAKARYYLDRIGIYFSSGLQLSSIHFDDKKRDNINDLAVLFELGYAYFLSKTVTLEPAIYWDLSAKDSDHSKIGFKIGFGFYF